MGSVQAVPVIGEIATVAETTGKAIAAGACAAVGKTEAAEQLWQGAGQSLQNYTEVSAIGANIHMAVAAASHDDKKVELLKERQAKAWLDVAENTPVVGHTIGTVRYVIGDHEGGDRCMIGATRSTLVLVATVATGGTAGVLACGAAAASSGVAYDAVATRCNSVAKGGFAPVGLMAGIDHAIKTGNANDIFNAAAIPAADFLAGSAHAYMRGRNGIAANRVTAANRRLSRSRLESYSVHREVQGAIPQVPLAEMRGNPRTLSFLREFSSPEEAIQQLERGLSYDFVRMRDGSIRAIDHSHAREAAGIHGQNVGHSSLVEPGTGVVAAGEIRLDRAGNVININCMSGHFRFSLDVMWNEKGEARMADLVP